MIPQLSHESFWSSILKMKFGVLILTTTGLLALPGCASSRVNSKATVPANEAATSALDPSNATSTLPVPVPQSSMPNSVSDALNNLNLLLPEPSVPCPTFSGTYTTKNSEGQIKVSDFKLSPEWISFPESEGLIPDGQTHSLPGTNHLSYVAKCFPSAVDIKVARIGKKPFRFIRYNLKEKSIQDQKITFTGTSKEKPEIEIEEVEWTLKP